MSAPENLIPLSEARERLAIGRSAMANLVRSGELPVVRVTPHNIRVKPSELERFIARRSSAPVSRTQIDRLAEAHRRNRAS